MKWALAIAVASSACLDEVHGLSCEEQVCEYVPSCSPATTNGWDFRTESACIESFACGALERKCIDAMLALPCLSQPPTKAELERSSRAFATARAACTQED